MIKPIGTLYSEFRTKEMAKDINWRGRFNWDSERLAYILQEAGLIKLIMGTDGKPISYHIVQYPYNRLREDKVREAIANHLADEKRKRGERFDRSLVGRAVAFIFGE